MANIKSQKKRILTNEKARLRNNAIKSELKTVTRRVKEAVEAQNKEAAEEALRFVSRKLDKAVSKGVLHKKNAANKKSGLAHLVNKLSYCQPLYEAHCEVIRFPRRFSPGGEFFVPASRAGSRFQRALWENKR